MIRRAIACAALLALGVSSATAQVAPPSRGGRSGGARIGQPPLGRRGDIATQDNRQLLERRVRQAIARVTRQRLGLNDAQMTQLTQVDMRFEGQRRQLFQEQRQNRIALRAAILDTAAVDQARVGQYMDKLLQLERRRVELLEAEQRDLAGFLTPLQRAKYQALQENVRRRLEDTMRPMPLPGDSAAGLAPAGQRAGARRRPLIRPPGL